ncbi:hypothetical protein [Caldovatus sediminis]|uniref:hypothetical protein n=1 Tax=Caldovatus sediminis TaxID=2041189 RepID=UPI00166A3DB4|nr:hypothetical protein [Caldovatus sediminis]
MPSRSTCGLPITATIAWRPSGRTVAAWLAGPVCSTATTWRSAARTTATLPEAVAAISA